MGTWGACIRRSHTRFPARPDVSRVPGLHGHEVDVLSIHAWCEGLQEEVGVHLLVNPVQAQRGSLLSDTRGRPLRGTAARLQALLQTEAESKAPQHPPT